MNRSKKLRPYLSAKEIKYILSILKGNDPDELLIIRTLNQTLFNYEQGFSKGAYQPSPKPSIEESLGFTPAKFPSVSIVNKLSDEDSKYLNGEMSEEEEKNYLEKTLK